MIQPLWNLMHSIPTTLNLQLTYTPNANDTFGCIALQHTLYDLARARWDNSQVIQNQGHIYQKAQ